MYFRYSLTVPPLTSRAHPVRVQMGVGPGILHTIEVGFPPGCAGLVHVYITHWEQQLWPWNTDETWAWDDYNIRMTQLDFGVTTPPYLFHLCAWSEDDSYTHTIACRLGIKLPDPHRPGSWIKRMLTGEAQG